MSSGRKPTASEILNLLDRVERDPQLRGQLASGYEIFRACVAAGLLKDDSIDWLAQGMQDLHNEDLIAHGPISAGAYEPVVWDGHWLQSVHDWRVTSKGRKDVLVEREVAGAIEQEQLATGSGSPSTSKDDDNHDLFICHASEDKETVARPLLTALTARGWSVWLDELELTVGDSISGGIEAALVRSRFGVVVLSPAFFTKLWPQRELSGLAAREVEAGSKVILPVWHGIDRDYIVQRAPILADRLGAQTKFGIERVADEISHALERSGRLATIGLVTEPVVQAVESQDGQLLTIPSTAEEQAILVSERPRFWEYLVFVGVLVQGKNQLETKWDDHELRLAGGARREPAEDAVSSFLAREMGWVSRQAEVLDRVFGSTVQEEAFGASGEPGNPVRIENFARRIIAIYESFLDWAASLRNTAVPRVYDELLEANACFVDAPIAQIREFIDVAADQTSRLLEIVANATDEHPASLELVLKLEVDPAVLERQRGAIARLEQTAGKP